jgi:hypothetical protein
VNEFRAKLTRDQAAETLADSVTVPDFVPANWTL